MEGTIAISSVSVKKPEKTVKGGLGSKTVPTERARLQTETFLKTGELQEVKEIKVEKVARAIEKFVQSIQTGLQIHVHKATGKIVVKVISKEDGRVIREIPPEEMLNIAAKMERMAGVFFDKNM